METTMKLGLVHDLPAAVSEIELAALKRDRAMLKALLADYEEFERDILWREQDIIDRVERGARVDGKVAVITRRKQSISWLTAFKEALGEAKVLEVKDRWPVTFYKVLQLP